MKTILKQYSILLVALSMLACAGAIGQLDRTKQPQPGAPPALKLPAIQRGTLENGMDVLVVEHHELPVVQMQMVFKTGADADPIGKAGVASMTSDLLDEGTQSRNALQIADEVDFLGASIGTSSSFDGSFVNLTTLKEHLDKAMELYSDVILRPSFPATEFDRLKKELLTELLQQRDEPGTVASNVFFRELYGMDHPYGYQVNGSDSTVKSMSLEDIRAFYEQNYVPNNATLIVVGDIDKESAMQVAKTSFGSWKSKPLQARAIPAPAARQNKTTLYFIDKPGAAQSEIRIGNIGVQRNSEDYFSVSLLNQILGSSNGRLYLNLREAKGYTYGAYSQFTMRKQAGPFFVYGGIRTNVTDSAMAEFMKEIRRVGEDLVPEQEFAMYKAAVIQRLPRLFETPAQISGQLSSVVLYGLPDDYFDSLVERYSAVTQEDVRRVAQKYIHPDALVVVVVGDKAQVQEKLTKLGFTTIVEADEFGNELK